MKGFESGLLWGLWLGGGLTLTSIGMGVLASYLLRGGW